MDMVEIALQVRRSMRWITGMYCTVHTTLKSVVPWFYCRHNQPCCILVVESGNIPGSILIRVHSYPKVPNLSSPKTIPYFIRRDTRPSAWYGLILASDAYCGSYPESYSWSDTDPLRSNPSKYTGYLKLVFDSFSMCASHYKAPLLFSLQD